ncbi:Rqc2 family fibronectin-binding protein [Nitrolancea hollandica]|uniref:Rqc2 homolog RqcH n=1 Tax=Nitrolancea hollandica Lb TaxID=1129897 RepID=I4EGQ1_9BACT|nr:NFACT RNA binding domain-containing protein [Nitrolancea hollandica]CCF83863.1 Fibronectin-binding A domain protein [Nitrolancea hollandica Lb]
MFDTLTMAALADELAGRIIDGRIQKVIQIGDAAIGLEIYAEHQRRVLIASAESRNPHLYLSPARVTADPDRVTPLLLLLRKYARGGWITGVEQPRLERIIRVSIAKPFYPGKHGEDGDEIPDDGEDDFGPEGELVHTHLIIELMGRHSNVIFTDDAGKILDVAKRVTPQMSRVRPVLPGRIYEPPPPQAKHDPRSLSAPALAALMAASPPDSDLAGLLVRSLAGFSPQMAREAVYRAFDTMELAVGAVSPQAVEALAGGLEAVLAPLETGHWEPSGYLVDGVPVAFSAIRLEHRRDAEEIRYGSISEAIERYLAASPVAQPVRHAQRRAKLALRIGNARERIAARLRSLEEEQERAALAEQWRTMGELIYASIYQIQPGQRELETDGLHIPLDPARSPSENAQSYFERYRKARSATANLPELVERTWAELAYLEQLETLANLAEQFDDIEQLRREWETYDWERRGVTSPKARREPAPKRPRPYRTAGGDMIYVGHNGRQNELITFDIAGPDDLWFHARGLPGAHVIVQLNGPERDEAIEKAAALAAYYSSGQGSTTVDVDTTRRRYVRKVKGGQPGLVTYREERTLRVRPQNPENLGLEGRPR